MKKKALISSILTIALCLSLIAGSTFALFTSTDEVNIAVTAAKVEMTASLTDLKLESVKADPNGTIVDENGGTYSYVECAGNFSNGGTATFDEATKTLKLDRVTPGDRVSFNAQGANTSDVTIQYRYVVECSGDALLMSGLLVTIGDIAYPALDSYTSAWSTLQPGQNIEAVPVIVELPVTAGDKYQEQSTSIKVTVEAVQGNANVQGAQPVVEFLDGYTADLGDQTLSDTVINYGNVEIANGTIVLDSVGVENYGDATLTDMTIAAGTSGTQAYGYAYIGRGGSTTVLDNVTVNSANGAIAAVDGAQLTMNSGSVEVNSKSTSGRYLVYAVGSDTVITINDGDFGDFTKTSQNQKRSYVYAGDGATVYINGGTFGKASTRDGYPGIKTDDNPETKVIITGGTFGFDPSAWVKTGYKAVKNTTTNQWVVEPIELADVKDALNSGNDVVLGGDIDANDKSEYVSNAYGSSAISVTQGQTIDGNGNTIYAPQANSTWDSAINITGGTIKNLTVGSGFRGIFINHNSSNVGKVYLENVIIDGPTYTISCDQGSNNGLEAIKSTFNGWTSYAGTLGDVKFVECSFGEGSGYAFCRPYATTEFIGCNFEAGYVIDARAAVTFKNCTIDGVALTAENLATLVVYNIDNATVIE